VGGDGERRRSRWDGEKKKGKKSGEKASVKTKGSSTGVSKRSRRGAVRASPNRQNKGTKKKKKACASKEGGKPPTLDASVRQVRTEGRGVFPPCV